MDLNALTQLGVGGMFAYLLIKQVLDFLSKRKGPAETPSSGERPVEYWQREIRQAVAESISPALDRQSSALHELSGTLAQLSTTMTRILVMLEHRPSGDRA